MNPEQPLYQVVYSSRSVKSLRDLDVTRILEVARSRNLANGLTGMLLIRGDLFVQVLEGDKKELFATLDRIRRDPRHKDLKVLIEGPGDRRVFPKWTMGVVDGRAGEKEAADVLAVVEKAVRGEKDLRQAIVKILKVFNAPPETRTETASELFRATK